MERQFFMEMQIHFFWKCEAILDWNAKLLLIVGQTFAHTFWYFKIRLMFIVLKKCTLNLLDFEWLTQLWLLLRDSPSSKPGNGHSLSLWGKFCLCQQALQFCFRSRLFNFAFGFVAEFVTQFCTEYGVQIIWNSLYYKKSCGTKYLMIHHAAALYLQHLST